MTVEAEDLADRDLAVLKRVREHPESTTTTLRETFWWADVNQHVHYRLDNLEEAGLIETWLDDDIKKRGPLSPRRARVTDAGKEFLALVDDDREKGIEERLGKLEKQVERWGDTHGHVKKRIVESEESIDELQTEMRRVREDIERVQEQLSELRESRMELASGFSFGDN